jgi:hypothetical protein
MENGDGLSHLHQDVVRTYGKVAAKVAEGTLQFRYVDFVGSARKITEFKQLFQKFLNEPSESSLRAFWNRNYLELSAGGCSAGRLLAGSPDRIPTIQAVLSDLDRSDAYDKVWEAL